MSKPIPVMPSMCATCPFREGGLEEVRPLLQHRALSEASPICHSTGEGERTNYILGEDKPSRGPERICRGARNFQIRYFHLIGFIAAATDEAWNDKCREMGIPVPGGQ